MRRPIPADFAPRPSAARHLAWEEADRAARPARLARLRANLAAGGLDAYFGLRREEIRYLAGVVLGEGEEKVAGHSGRFLVSGDALVVTINEKLLKRSIDRQLAREAAAKDKTAAAPAVVEKPWLGSNLGLQVNRKAVGSVNAFQKWLDTGPAVREQHAAVFLTRKLRMKNVNRSTGQNQ